MLKWIMWVVVLLLLSVFTVAGSFLYKAHRQIDSINPPLPSMAEIRAAIFAVKNSASPGADLPVSIEVALSASQRSPLSSVLDDFSGTGLQPEGLYDMSFPVFIISWADGRKFIVDAGLSRQEAASFGKSAELLGAEPMVFNGSLDKLVDVNKIAGIGFTHLHKDHVLGAEALCMPSAKRLPGKPILMVQTAEQFSTGNYLTQPAEAVLAGLECGQRFIIKDTLRLKSVSGFAGLKIIHVAGHTPGSQVFVVPVMQAGKVHTYILAGDLVNHGAGITYNISKPNWYSLLVTPENLSQLERARRWLKMLAEETDIDVLVSHDQQQIDRALQAVPAVNLVPIAN
ncbi:MAG: hypothetical protein KUG79_01900 [Pseudomonadales bacterium]|nr:hypothetical protein [Pseudomonadales bacterium]